MIARNRFFKDLLWSLALLGAVAALFRLVYGLGATTHLSDAVPWGLWKILNMVAGVALSTSGFTVGFLVYVLRRERYRPLVKPAVLVAFLGYGSSCLALLFDIGRPDRFWHPFVMWNDHSFLFEVFWCVMLYFTVTAVELSPTILERLGSERVARWLHHVAFAVVVFGISLSCLHHSSLGSLFLVSPFRLHGLWYSRLLPLFFILSAIGGGMMFLVLVRLIHAHWYDPRAVRSSAPGVEARDLPMLRGLAEIAVSVLTLYMVLKLIDLLRTGTWRLLAAGTWESALYAVELALAALIPVALIATPRARRTVAGLTVASLSASLGLVLNRLDVGIFGYWRDARTVYFPSLAEWALSLGVIAAAGIVFLFVVEHIPIFPPTAARAPARRRRASFDAFTQVWSGVLEGGLHRVSLIAALVIPLGWVLMYPPYHRGKTATMPRAIGLDATRSVLRLAGGATAISTDFPHVAHQERLGGKESCVVCHHVSLPGDRSTACSRCHRHELAPTSMFRHHGHMAAVAASEHVGGMVPANRSCSYCHAPGEPNTAASAKACFECHQKDMWLLGKPDSSLNLAEATSFLDAMHGTCLECHRREEARGVKEGLAECGTCHRTLRPRGWKPPAPAKQYAVRPVTAAPRADAQASLSASERDGGATH